MSNVVISARVLFGSNRFSFPLYFIDSPNSELPIASGQLTNLIDIISVDNAGDINGDGIDDIILGRPNDNRGAGESYIIYGREQDFELGPELVLFDGIRGFIINGIETGDISGFSVSGIGDINGDDIDDLIIGAPNSNGSRGASYVVFGSDSLFPSSLNLFSLDGSNGFTIPGIDAGDSLGFVVSSAGDVNGDGINDLIIGAPYRQNGTGASYVVFGRSTGFDASLDLASLDGSNGFTISGISVGDAAATSVSSAGDVNGDGISDLVIGAPNRADSTGETYVVFGSSNGFSNNLDLSSLDGSNGFVIPGLNPGDLSGFSVSSAGDITGDGIDDLVIGAPNHDNLAGATYLIFGRNTFSSSLDLSELDGSNGFIIPGLETGDASGFSVSKAGDINGDGLGDLIIGAPNYADRTGESYVVFGQSSGFAASLDLNRLNGSNGFIIPGPTDDTNFGLSVSSAGDINNDGFDDLVVGSASRDEYGNYTAESYVILGRNSFETDLYISTTENSSVTTESVLEYHSELGDISTLFITDVDIVATQGIVTNHGDGTFSYDPDGQFDHLALGQSTTDTFTYTVTNSGGTSQTKTVIITIDGDNLAEPDAPFAVDSIDPINDADSNSSGVRYKWQQPNGLDSEVTLTYSYSNLLDGSLALEAPTVVSAIEEALALWATYAPINFVEVPDSGPDPSSHYYEAGDQADIRFGLTSFDGEGNIFGRAYFPYSQDDGRSGDIHFDIDESWSTNPNNGLDILEIAVHEIGHALGLDHEHSNDISAILDPYYSGVFSGIGTSFLFEHDISEIQHLYGIGTGSTVNLEKILGNHTDEHLLGTAEADIIQGYAGNDELWGEAGADFLFGGIGNDLISGETGDDNIIGNSGDNIIEGLDGSDNLQGQRGDDIISGGVGADQLEGNEGNDYLQGQAGNDFMRGGSGHDSLLGGEGNDILDGESGDDWLEGGLGNDDYHIDSINDVIIENFDEGYDTVNSSISYVLGNHLERLNLKDSGAIDAVGNNLDNILFGNNSNNIIDGLDGSDQLQGLDGNDTVRGGDGNDTLDGDSGNDQLIGGSGNDFMRGGTGNDTLIGGANDDILSGGINSDYLVGGDGEDIFYFDQGDSQLSNFDVIADLTIGTDIIDAFNTLTSVEVQQLISISNFDEIGIQAELTTSTFAANGAAALSYNNRVFLVLNDEIAGYSAASDSIVEITGFSGNLGDLIVL